MKNHKL